MKAETEQVLPMGDNPRTFLRAPTPRIPDLEKQSILALLCKRCGGYCGPNQQHCMPCVARLRKTIPHKRDYWAPRNISPMDKMKISPPPGKAFQHVGQYCTDCNISTKQVGSDLCLICDAKRRARSREKTFAFLCEVSAVNWDGQRKERNRERTFALKTDQFGTGDIIKSFEKETPRSKLGKSIRCTNCKKKVRQRDKLVCPECDIKQRPVIIPGQFIKELEKYIKDANAIKDHFTKSKWAEGKPQWDGAFQARKESLEQIRLSIRQMKPRGKFEKEKHNEAKLYIHQVIEMVSLHHSTQKALRNIQTAPVDGTKNGNRLTDTISGIKEEDTRTRSVAETTKGAI